jgi:hypothetical protein
MFNQILQLVKEHLDNSPEVSNQIPDDKKEAVYNEITTHLHKGLNNDEALPGGTDNILSMLKNAMSSDNPLVHAIEGGIVGSLASKFGFSPVITGAVAGALPGLLQKYARKAADPNDTSITLNKTEESLPQQNNPAQ